MVEPINCNVCRCVSVCVSVYFFPQLENLCNAIKRFQLGNYICDITFLQFLVFVFYAKVMAKFFNVLLMEGLELRISNFDRVVKLNVKEQAKALKFFPE